MTLPMIYRSFRSYRPKLPNAFSRARTTRLSAAGSAKLLRSATSCMGHRPSRSTVKMSSSRKPLSGRRG
jgi:hypothetical protein